MNRCTLPTPTTLRTRPLLDGERRAVLDAFAGLSERSRFLRFHTGMPRLTEGALRHLSTVRPGIQEAWVAEVDDAIVGIARWHRLGDAPGSAEVAVAVADAHHGRGIGRALVAATLRSARAAGIEELVMEVHPENAVVRRWLADAGPVATVSWDSASVRTADAVALLGGPSDTCDSMTGWSTASSDRSAPAMGATSHPRVVTARATSSPCSWSGVGTPSAPEPCSSSSGARRLVS